MALSFREKDGLYRSLAEYAKAGITFPSAIEKLTLTARGDTRGLLRKLGASLAAGATVGDAVRKAQPAVSPLEAGVITAVERSGRIEHGLMQLSEYFAALAAARSTMITRSLYPVFVFNFGAIILNAKIAFTAGVPAYLTAVLTSLIWFWGGLLCVWLLSRLLADLAATDPFFDRLLRMVPAIGRIRRAFAGARFCLTYEMQLDAGLNLLDALETAGRASRSGLVRAAVARALPAARSGEKVGPALAAGSALSPDVTQAIVLGEETGALDRELRRVAAAQQGEALLVLGRVTEWLPRLLYIAIVLYVGWTIIALYMGYMNLIRELTGG